MSILGVIVRVRPALKASVAAQLSTTPGVEIALDPGDGRLVLVIEDALVDGQRQPAAATMAAIANAPQMLCTSLVYEHSGDEPPMPAAEAIDYRAWRGSLQTLGAEGARST